MGLFLWILVLLISLTVLVKATDFFVPNSEKLGILLGLSPFVVGVTIVAFGTSLPELVTSLIAVSQSTPINDLTEIVAGNIIGSNIANIFLVVGIAALVGGGLTITRSLINIDLPILAASTMILLLILFWDGQVTLGEGIISLIGYGVYMWYAIRGPTRTKEETDVEERNIASVDDKLTKELKKEGWIKPLLIVIASAVFIFIGAKYTIDSVVALSTILNIATSVIAISAVAVGTSLPELFVSVKAALNKKPEIALGNIFGSNIFNGFVVLGVPSLFKTLTVSPTTLTIGIPFLFAATMLFVFSGISKKIYTFEGAMFLLLYVLFIAKLFNLF